MAKRKPSAYQRRYRHLRNLGYDPQRARRGAKSGVGGCYIATSVYGSYDCPQVWVLRRFRDNKLAKSVLGRSFIKTYYAVSPTLVQWFGDTRLFKSVFGSCLNRLVNRLKENGFSDAPYDD